MALYTALRNNPKMTQRELEESIDGNLCRCTGYRPILDAAKSFATDKDECCSRRADGTCCRDRSWEKDWAEGHGATSRTMFRVVSSTAAKLNSKLCADDYTGAAEPVFPAKLRLQEALQPLLLKGKRVTWYRPTSLAQLLAVKRDSPDAKLVLGNTEVGIETKFKRFVYPVRIHVGAVPELHGFSVVEPAAGGGDGVRARGGVEIGGCVTLSELK